MTDADILEHFGKVGCFLPVSHSAADVVVRNSDFVTDKARARKVSGDDIARLFSRSQKPIPRFV
ncbi:hypothetical protein D9M71_731110 [compost metagenome]